MRQTQNPLYVFGRMWHHRKLFFYAWAGRRTLRQPVNNCLFTDVACIFWLICEGIIGLLELVISSGGEYLGPGFVVEGDKK